MLREQGGGGDFIIMKTILRKTIKEKFKLKYQNQSREQTLCKVVIFKFVFCWLLFRDKFDCNYIQSFVPCIYCGI